MYSSKFIDQAKAVWRKGTVVLDDLKYIHEHDGQDALGIAEKQWQQLEHMFELPDLSFSVENIVYTGMGGSALSAIISQSWPGYHLPFEVVRGYNLPDYVSDKTLCIIASYSGNTEETLACLDEAKAKGANIVIIAGGGKLQEIAQQNNYPLAFVPKAVQPRFATLFILKAIVTILQKSNLLADKDTEQSLVRAKDFLQQSIQTWIPTVPTSNNQAKQLAQELMGKSIVVYSGPKLFPAAYKWKISFNENAKHIAWCNQLPEADHNEILGWTKQPVQKPYAVIDIRSNLDHPRIQKRFIVTDRLLSGLRPAPIVVNPKGETLLEQMLWTIVLGDFVSLYLALLNGLNPTPVELIEKLKKALAE